MLYVVTYLTISLAFALVFGFSERVVVGAVVFGAVLATFVTVTTFAAVFAMPTIDRASRRAIRAALRRHGSAG